MAEPTIRMTVANGVATIVLNRPDVLNSFTRAMGAEMQAALDDGASREDVRAVLITGAGRAFCAGQDLAEAAPPDSDWPDIRDFVEATYNPTVRAIREMEKPVIAAVNGVAAGAGANIALACDFVIAAESAAFLQAFCHIGLIPDSGGTFFLPRLVGMARATALTMLGEKLPATEALAMGLIYKVVPGDDLMTEAGKLAAHLATRPTRGLGLIKRALNASWSNDLVNQLALEAELQGEAGATDDYREGVTAFLEKRKPAFRGR